MEDTVPAPFSSAQALLRELKSFLLPGGMETARPIRGITTEQRGRIRAAPEAKWNPLTATEWVDATRSEFKWEADFGGNIITSVHVTDAYAEGHGKLVLRKGPVPLKRMDGSDVDKGELQRYLGYVCTCPPILLHHRTLAWTAVGPRTLRVRDMLDQSGAWLDLDLGPDGTPLEMRTVRPMSVGKQSVDTPWSAMCRDFVEQEGIRIPRRLEAAWHPSTGAFTYVELEVVEVTFARFSAAQSEP